MSGATEPPACNAVSTYDEYESELPSNEYRSNSVSRNGFSFLYFSIISGTVPSSA